MDQPITRRRFVGLGAAGAAALLAGGRLACAADPAAGRFKARPGKPAQTVKPGVTDLGLAQGRDGSLYVPADYDPGKPMPLLVMLHGALGREPGFRSFSRLASANGMVVLEPDARGRTWDFDFSAAAGDLAFLDRALAYVFARVNVDPRRLALGGFSDGASYALSAGLPNGDLFTHLLAFSPGFMQPPGRQGKPAIWVSHGTRDEILPIEASRERIVPQLKRWGYAVHYREFDGPHGVTPEVVKESFRWFVG